MSHSILEVFLEDHKRLTKLFEGYIQARKERSIDTTTRLNDFCNAMKKHIRAEEEMYMQLEDMHNETINKAMRMVRKEHTQINALIEECLEDMPEESCIRELFLLLQSHEQFEETQFYNLLDELLSEKEKHDIITRLKLYA